MNDKVIRAIKSAGASLGLSSLGEPLDNQIKLYMSNGACIQVMINDAWVGLSILENGRLISRMNTIIDIRRMTWEMDLIDEMYALTELYKQAGVCNSCGKPMAIYKVTDKDHKHYGEFFARCPGKQVSSDKHTQKWLTVEEA